MSRIIISFIFLFSFLAANQASARLMANDQCYAPYNQCYQAAQRNNKTPSLVKQAQDRCSVSYNSCLEKAGVVKNERGYAQLYHPSNPDYVACQKQLPGVDTASAKFRSCMDSKSSKPTAAATPAKTASSSASRCGVRPAGQEGCCDPENLNHWGIIYCEQSECVADKNLDWYAGKCFPKEAVTCSSGTTLDHTVNKCKCDSSKTILDNGNQQCPETCTGANVTYNSTSKQCDCRQGYIPDDEDILANELQCKKGTSSSEVAACLSDVEAKATSCKETAESAVTRCDANSKDAQGDAQIEAMQKVLSGVNAYVQMKSQGSGAYDNCLNAGLASQTGYYALEQMKASCEDKISQCKSDCESADEYISTHKAELVQKCKQEISASDVDSQLSQISSRISSSQGKCVSDNTGDAEGNKNQMVSYLKGMNDSARQANQCKCQLSAGSSGFSNCTQAALGPADCIRNPNQVGCVDAQVNCLVSNTPQCICFRDPTSANCSVGQKQAIAEISKMAGGTNPFAGLGNPNSKVETNASNVNIDGLDFGSDKAAVSGSAKTDASNSPFGVAGGSSGGGAGGGFGSSGGGGGSGSAAEGGEGNNKGLGGFFNTAKSALGSLFGKNPGNKSSEYGDGNGKNGKGGVDPSKWRPQGAIRGIAGEGEIGSKFQDIWKKMNQQYKTQDQRDKFFVGDSEK